MNSDCLLLIIKAAPTCCTRWAGTCWAVQNSTLVDMKFLSQQ